MSKKKNQQTPSAGNNQQAQSSSPAPTPTPPQPTQTINGPCVHKRPKMSGFGLTVLVLIPIVLITIFVFGSKGCGQSKEPRFILGPLKETKEVGFKLEKTDDLVRLETKGRKFTIEWIEPKKASENLLEYLAHGKMGMHGGDIVSSAWVRPPFQFPPTGIEDDIGWISFRLDEGNGPIVGKVHFFEREMIPTQP